MPQSTQFQRLNQPVGDELTPLKKVDHLPGIQGGRMAFEVKNHGPGHLNDFKLRVKFHGATTSDFHEVKLGGKLVLHGCPIKELEKLGPGESGYMVLELGPYVHFQFHAKAMAFNEDPNDTTPVEVCTDSVEEPDLQNVRGKLSTIVSVCGIRGY
jgi:hypothetical protein